MAEGRARRGYRDGAYLQARAHGNSNKFQDTLLTGDRWDASVQGALRIFCNKSFHRLQSNKRQLVGAITIARHQRDERRNMLLEISADPIQLCVALTTPGSPHDGPRGHGQAVENHQALSCGQAQFISISLDEATTADDMAVMCVHSYVLVDFERSKSSVLEAASLPALVLQRKLVALGTDDASVMLEKLASFSASVHCAAHCVSLSASVMDKHRNIKGGGPDGQQVSAMYTSPSPFFALDFPELTTFANVGGPGSCLVYNGSSHLALQPHGNGSVADEVDSDSENEETWGQRLEEGSELGSELVQLYAIHPKGGRASLVPASDFQQHVDSAKQELAATAVAVVRDLVPVPTGACLRTCCCVQARDKQPSDKDFLERLAIVKAQYCMEATLANGQRAPALCGAKLNSSQPS
ncbi:hypothetical protein QJQ45_030325 [Haematococcus lacustris]|nr:hypothetical protein QJQ45_030325 [Haematococcus lacustris]